MLWVEGEVVVVGAGGTVAAEEEEDGVGLVEMGRRRGASIGCVAMAVAEHGERRPKRVAWGVGTSCHDQSTTIMRAARVI